MDFHEALEKFCFLDLKRWEEVYIQKSELSRFVFLEAGGVRMNVQLIVNDNNFEPFTIQG